MTPLLFVLVSLVILILVSGGYVFFAACRRGREPDWLDRNALRETAYERFSDHISDGDQWLKAHCAQDVYIESRDGLRLHGLWVPAEEPKGTVLLVHGYRSCYLVDFGLAFDYYHSLGLNLLIPEQRSHGKSQGKYITFGVKESGDMLLWIAHHNRAFGIYPLVLTGLSMGASTVMYLANEKLPKNVRGIIADCGYTSPKAILAHVFKRTVHLPAGPSLWVTDLFARIFAGFSLGQKDTRKTLAANRLPILMIHGTADTFVPCSMTRESFGSCSGPKELLLAQGAKHGVSFLHIRERYTAAVIRFLKAYIEGF